MAQRKETVLIKHIKKATSQGMAGRGRKIKVYETHEQTQGLQQKTKYRGQGR